MRVKYILNIWDILQSNCLDRKKTLLKLLKPGEARQCKILLKSDDHCAC